MAAVRNSHFMNQILSLNAVDVGVSASVQRVGVSLIKEILLHRS